MPLRSKPGEEFLYSDPDAQLVSAIVTEATGMSTLDYARVKLFDPLGIASAPAYTSVEPWNRIDVTENTGKPFERAGFAWAVAEDGVTNGCCMLKLKPADMQKIGQLYLSGGQWQGRQIVPADWIRQATSPSPTEASYGMFWWLASLGGRQAFAAEGRGGQLIAVVPETRTVITVSTTPLPGTELAADDVIYMINSLITKP
jgi:CubicO group peptidase (beta-lactamase class C family)